MILTRKKITDISNSYRILEREALLLLAHILESNYSKLFFEKEFDISNDKFELFISYLHRLRKNEPISKILQKKEFYGIEYITNQHTLDPRPETELIVDLFKKYYSSTELSLKILDLGSGTGCIGLTILSLYKNASCDFVDISNEALAITETNAKRLGLEKRSKLQISNWFSNLETRTYDVIVSNPPYVAENYPIDGGALYDPKLALFAGPKGLDAYEKILPVAHEFLKLDGKLFLEIGYDQSDSVTNIHTNLQLIEKAIDLSGIYRVLVFSKS